MLVLSRLVDQTIEVDGPCTITVCKIQPGRVKIGITAAQSVAVVRPDAKQMRQSVEALPRPIAGELRAVGE